MSAVTVFVDEAVQGLLPTVCAKDGVPTADRIVIHEPIGSSSPGVAWILLLLGPLGWIGLLLVAATRGRDEVLTVQVPYCEDDYRRLLTARRTRTTSVVVAAGSAVAWLALAVLHVGHLITGADWARAGFVAVAALALHALYTQWQLGRHQIGVGLDASRRWVTLTRVDARFVAAVEARYLRPHRS